MMGVWVLCGWLREMMGLRSSWDSTRCLTPARSREPNGAGCNYGARAGKPWGTQEAPAGRHGDSRGHGATGTAPSGGGTPPAPRAVAVLRCFLLPEPSAAPPAPRCAGCGAQRLGLFMEPGAGGDSAL